MIDYKQVFKKRFSILNSAQQEAVNNIFGPLAVIAGPGTGKTEVLAARIANILNSPDAGVNPANILCLTYTEAGVISMRKRLLEFIGPTAHKININTFHGFCNEIIQDNLDYFGKREQSLLSDLEKLKILESIVDSFKSDNPLYQVSGYSEVSRLDNLFRVMKQESWSYDDVKKSSDEYLESIKTREDFIYKRKSGDFQAGDLKIEKYRLEEKKMQMLLSAAKEYETYQSTLKSMGRYDYNDMIIWVLDAFLKNPELLSVYQERYQFVLVDEFQDTNGSQNELLKRLLSYWDSPNVFIVGDDDQSIYRFQGANLRNIVDFYNQYSNKVSSVVLKENYRSVPEVLELANELIANNEERLVNEIDSLDKNLVSASDLKNVSNKVRIIEYESKMQEEAMVIDKITKLASSGEKLSDIAIIYRNHAQAENFIKLLDKKDIAINVKETTNILELRFYQQIYELLSYLSKEASRPGSGDEHLFSIMHFDFFSIDASTIARLFGVSRRKRKLFREIIPELEKSFKRRDQLIEFNEIIDELIQSSFNQTLIEFVETVINRANILSYVLSHRESAYYMRILTTIFNFLKEELAKKPDLKLEEFLDLLSQMQKYGISLPVNKMSLSKDGVNLITAHSSKGLEFKYVFLVSVNNNVWDKQNKSRFNYKFPDTLTMSNEGSDIEEQRRLFYVALTRAKEHLEISYYLQNNEGRECIESQFISEISQSKSVEFKKEHASDELMLDYSANLLSLVEPKENKILDHAFIDEILSSYRLSVTHLNKYLRCPVAFYYENILRIPSGLNEYMSFGNAIHYSLEHYFKESIKRGDLLDSDFLLECFHRAMKMYRFSFLDSQYKRRMTYGKEVLLKYYENYFKTWNLNLSLEYKIFNAEYEGVPLSGQFDKIEYLDSNKINIVDYKTGNYQKAKSKLTPPSVDDPYGGDYWRQLVFYKILMKADSKSNLEVDKTILDFIEPDSKTGEFHKELMQSSIEDEQLVGELIKNTYGSIMNHEFFFGCQDPYCQWCEFNKQLNQ